jgi:hypothetical protein
MQEIVMIVAPAPRDRAHRIRGSLRGSTRTPRGVMKGLWLRRLAKGVARGLA